MDMHPWIPRNFIVFSINALGMECGTEYSKNIKTTKSDFKLKSALTIQMPCNQWNSIA